MGGDRKIGVIGGSGLYDIDGLEGARWMAVPCALGAPSDQVLAGRIDGVEMVFLPRHGRGHRHSPTSIPYRANIAVMKGLGVTDLVSVSAVGSLRGDYAPGDFVVVDQFIDRTYARQKTFFGEGLVGHVPFAEPVCAALSAACLAAGRAAGATMRAGGTYVVMEGPQFSTRAESLLHKSWSADVIGMTAMPEAKLAREAELCYACVAMVTDYDAWRPGHDAVDVAQVTATAAANADRMRALIRALPAAVAARACASGCGHALDGAIMTAPGRRDGALARSLLAVMGRVLKDDK